MEIEKAKKTITVEVVPSIVAEKSTHSEYYELEVGAEATSIDIETIEKLTKKKFLGCQILNRLEESNSYVLLGLYTKESRSITLPIQNDKVNFKYRKMNGIVRHIPQFEVERKSGRTVQRTIAEASRLVYQWQRIMKEQKLSQADAADLLSISKKTLNGYLKEIKKGREKKFDFTGNNMHLPMKNLKRFNHNFGN
eukprot:TRINITY_DN5178_c0_g1_i5.p1 TRINITY_DN5178_c0_g1~~TRINITY_DN5178_c0_g1_i5.p1  ORF type:complete len:195 (+),score=40.92 TRINITY_DN5178_c0_g1_i5:209-793(+)